MKEQRILNKIIQILFTSSLEPSLFELSINVLYNFILALIKTYNYNISFITETYEYLGTYSYFEE